MFGKIPECLNYIPKAGENQTSGRRFLQFDSSNKKSYSWEEMAWIARQYSKGAIDRAGEALSTQPSGSPDRNTALAIINNWRACHAYPLQIIKMVLKTRAKSIDRDALISQRLKRLPSIQLKLRQNLTMQLSQMQDIGGCRAVLTNVNNIDRLVEIYRTTKSKKPSTSPVLQEPYDYITSPKSDGYRGIHLIYKYRSDAAHGKAYNGQRIEIQIRSRLQHAWATAVETAQAFTGQVLKSRIKYAEESWLRFFALMGSAIAERENRPTVPGTPENRRDRVKELREIIKQEKILDSLDAWRDAVYFLATPRVKDAHIFLLKLDPTLGNLQIMPFKKDQLAEAQKQYLQIEKDTENNPQIQVVLVLVDSIGTLRKAYPNYYADTREFIKAVQSEIS